MFTLTTLPHDSRMTAFCRGVILSGGPCCAAGGRAPVSPTAGAAAGEAGAAAAAAAEDPDAGSVVLWCAIDVDAGATSTVVIGF